MLFCIFIKSRTRQRCRCIKTYKITVKFYCKTYSFFNSILCLPRKPDYKIVINSYFCFFKYFYGSSNIIKSYVLAHFVKHILRTAFNTDTYKTASRFIHHLSHLKIRGISSCICRPGNF